MVEEKKYTMPWGRHRGIELHLIPSLDPEYFKWLISPHNDFVHPRNVFYHEIQKLI
jgi:hypothetical protein